MKGGSFRQLVEKNNTKEGLIYYLRYKHAPFFEHFISIKNNMISSKNLLKLSLFLLLKLKQLLKLNEIRLNGSLERLVKPEKKIKCGLKQSKIISLIFWPMRRNLQLLFYLLSCHKIKSIKFLILTSASKYILK